MIVLWKITQNWIQKEISLVGFRRLLLRHLENEEELLQEIWFFSLISLLFFISSLVTLELFKKKNIISQVFIFINNNLKEVPYCSSRVCDSEFLWLRTFSREFFISRSLSAFLTNKPTKSPYKPEATSIAIQ